MRESYIQGKIRAYLITNGWLTVKLINASPNGMPDLMAIKDGKVIFLEVKTEKGKTSKLQDYQIERLKEMGVSAFVVRSTVEMKEILKIGRAHV